MNTLIAPNRNVTEPKEPFVPTVETAKGFLKNISQSAYIATNRVLGGGRITLDKNIRRQTGWNPGVPVEQHLVWLEGSKEPDGVYLRFHYTLGED